MLSCLQLPAGNCKCTGCRPNDVVCFITLVLKVRHIECTSFPSVHEVKNIVVRQNHRLISTSHSFKIIHVMFAMRSFSLNFQFYVSVVNANLDIEYTGQVWVQGHIHI